MLCSFCSKSEPARIDINSLNLRICPNCLATYLPADQFAALRREIIDSTKSAWIRKLRTVETGAADVPLQCLEHKNPLVYGTIPGYSFEGFAPNCCNLQHLPASLMIKILEMGLGVPNMPASSMRGLARRSKTNGVSRFLGGFAFRFWEKRQKQVEDGLERLQYSFKFKDVLGEWIED